MFASNLKNTWEMKIIEKKHFIVSEYYFFKTYWLQRYSPLTYNKVKKIKLSFETLFFLWSISDCNSNVWLSYGLNKYRGHIYRKITTFIWVRSRNCGCLVTWFCYQLIAKPGNKTAAVSWPDPYTVECRYNAVLYNMILHTSLQELRQGINQSPNQQKTTYTSPWWVSYRVSFVNIFKIGENWSHYNGTTMYHVANGISGHRRTSTSKRWFSFPAIQINNACTCVWWKTLKHWKMCSLLINENLRAPRFTSS